MRLLSVRLRREPGGQGGGAGPAALGDGRCGLSVGHRAWLGVPLGAAWVSDSLEKLEWSRCRSGEKLQTRSQDSPLEVFLLKTSEEMS